MNISIIIPVYNAGPWLGRCLDSVIAQSYRDFECICIDDGSVDDSARILAQYAERDPRIRIISFPENRGVCAARNAGIDAARGDYVYFMDSDDWIDPDLLESLVSWASKTAQDVVINANYVEEYEAEGKRAFSSDFGFLGAEPGYYAPDLVQWKYPPVLWARLYKRSFLEKEKIRFPYLEAGVEDIYFTGLAEVLQAKSFIFRGPYYHYFQRSGSLIHQKEHGFWNIVSFEKLYRSWQEKGVETENLRLFYAGPMTIGSQEVFDRISPFLKEIAPQVRRHPEKYVELDRFLLEAVCNSEDYAAFRARYNANIAIAFVRSKFK